jgi:hypothetical protein
MKNERKEREARPAPAWPQTLAEYQRAYESFQFEPGSLSRVAFLDQTMERLRAAYQEPGLFALGEVMLTAAAFGELARGKHLAEEFLIRHKNGDWGDTSEEEAARNQEHVAKAHPAMKSLTDAGHTRGRMRPTRDGARRRKGGEKRGSEPTTVPGRRYPLMTASVTAPESATDPTTMCQPLVCRALEHVAKGWRIVSRYATRAGGEIRIATAPGLNETRLYGGDDDQPQR